MATFRALVLNELDGGVVASVDDVSDDDLPEGDVTIDVDWSSLNYKDGMVVRGIGRLVRQYPHIPGIDLAGTVSTSSDPALPAGTEVLVTGWRVGESRWGGYAGRARVRPEWVVPLPPGLTPRSAMALGTPGFTAILAADALAAHGVAPGSGPVLVTGAAGGLGSLAVHLLARRGYEVAASTGRPETHDYLRALGATTLVDRAELAEPPGRPMLAQRWAGCVDTVGGVTLAHVVAELHQRGSVSVCGNAGGNDLPTNVIPFLLRGVNLLGIDSAESPADARPSAWTRLAEEIEPAVLEALTTEVGLDEVPHMADEILAGRVRGRVVIRTS